MSSSLPLPIPAVIGIWLALYVLSLFLNAGYHKRLRQILPAHHSLTQDTHSPWRLESLARFFAFGLLVGVGAFVDEKVFVFMAGGQLIYILIFVGFNYLGLRTLKNPLTLKAIHGDTLPTDNDMKIRQEADREFNFFLALLFLMVGLLTAHLAPLGAAFFLLIGEASRTRP